jgi:ferredoxin
VRIEVDYSRCEGNALCMLAAPEVFQLDDNDHLTVLCDEVGDDLADGVRKAALQCPKQAIFITE